MDSSSLLTRLPIPSAPVLWGSVVGAVLVADALLVAQNRETMSDWYCRHAVPLGIVVTLLLMHLHGRPKVLARIDPLHLAAERIRRMAVRNGTLDSL